MINFEESSYNQNKDIQFSTFNYSIFKNLYQNFYSKFDNLNTSYSNSKNEVIISESLIKEFIFNQEQYTNSDDNSLRFDIKSIHNLKFEDLFSRYEKAMKQNNNKILIQSIYLFNIIKYLSQSLKIVSENRNDVLINDELILKKLNSEWTEMNQNLNNYIVFWVYKHKFFSNQESFNYVGTEIISKEKEIYFKTYNSEKLIGFIKQLLVKMISGELGAIVETLYVNQIALIHLFEFLVLNQKESLDINSSFEISLLRIHLIVGYFKWRESIKVNEF
jgi:hypothetical protein